MPGRGSRNDSLTVVRSVSMQSIAREFNLSETVFVLPPQDPHQRASLRIFTPGRELPFAAGVVFDGVADALRVPRSEIRLFGKPESFVKRRMGVALVHDADVELARVQAKLAASRVRPRQA